MVLCDQSTWGSIFHNMAKSTLCYLFSSFGFCKSRLDILLFGVGCPLTSGLSMFPLYTVKRFHISTGESAIGLATSLLGCEHTVSTFYFSFWYLGAFFYYMALAWGLGNVE